ncbi:hypothetical protein BV25DRAFT_1921181 [Artomyces pyxidatus]|uniref:Uncharacterized protein n=1 Tax=Artomyces pyxidatus TaxID=48021 RepID=A0ACB8SIX8_9AGAM|nr:hypothetical protein BV25DRAFT_1921181 [Artomyces pyxidatus]
MQGCVIRGVVVLALVYIARTPALFLNGTIAVYYPILSYPPVCLSILGFEPLDEFIREVADFVLHTINARPPDLQGLVEVEAKTGVLRGKQSGRRLALPVLSKMIRKTNKVDCRFQSKYVYSALSILSVLLNILTFRSLCGAKDATQTLLRRSQQPKSCLRPTDAPPSTPADTHLHLVDCFYLPEKLRNGDKICVTRDGKTGQVLKKLKKAHLTNLACTAQKAPRTSCQRSSCSRWHVPCPMSHVSIHKSSILRLSVNFPAAGADID